MLHVCLTNCELLHFFLTCCFIHLQILGEVSIITCFTTLSSVKETYTAGTYGDLKGHND